MAENGSVESFRGWVPQTDQTYQIKLPEKHGNLTRVHMHYLAMSLRLQNRESDPKALDLYKPAGTTVVEGDDGFAIVTTNDFYLINYFARIEHSWSSETLDVPPRRSAVIPAIGAVAAPVL